MGTLAGIAGLVLTFGDRLEKGEEKMQGGCGGDGNPLISFLRLKCKKGVEDQLGLMWIPEEFSQMAGPKDPNGWASPWLWFSIKLGVRWGAAFHPFDGLGCFLVGVKGRSLVWSWPMASVISSGGAVAEPLEMLGRLTVQKGKAFLVEHCQWACLEVPNRRTIRFGKWIIILFEFQN